MIQTQPVAACLGLDVAKHKLDACLLLGSHTRHAQFDNSASGLAALRAWCQRHGAATPATVLEATGRYGELAAGGLHAAGHLIHLANPRRIKKYAESLGRRNKTDRLDAEVIARFGATQDLPAWQPAEPAQQRLRGLLRRLADLELMLRAERNRQEAQVDPLLTKSLARIVRALEKESVRLQELITAHVQTTATLRDEVERLCAIEGIGTRSAWWLCAELPRHLPNGRTAAAWLGVTPRVRQSGSSLRSTAPAGTEGNRHLRRVLFMAAMVARRHNPRLKAFADRLAAAGKAKLAILLAVLHKLLKIAFALLKNQSAYDPTHRPFATTKLIQN